MPDTIAWNQRFSVGNETLDGQHQWLLKLCANATECLNSDSKEAAERIEAILNEMMRYAEEHFETEEAILRRHGYPLLAEQRAEHFEYIERLTDLLVEALAGTLNREALSQYLWAWWSHHILESDMKYSGFLKGKD